MKYGRSRADTGAVSDVLKILVAVGTIGGVVLAVTAVVAEYRAARSGGEARGRATRRALRDFLKVLP